MDGLPVIVMGIKSINPDTGNVADFSNRKALSLEALPPNWFRPQVSLELVVYQGIIILWTKEQKLQ